MSPEEQLFILKFIGCKEDRSPYDFAKRVFKPAICALVEEGYLRDGIYGLDGELSSEYFITRTHTKEFTDKILHTPHKNLIVCAWHDYAHLDGERLKNGGIPVEYLMLSGTKVHFNNHNLPENVIWLSSDWPLATSRFVARIIGHINILRTL